MNKKLLTFILHDHAKIIIKLNHSDDIVDACYQTKFLFKNYNHQYFIAHNFVGSNLADLQEKLNNALKNQLQLDEYFTHDIGYYWNFYLNKNNKIDRFNENYSVLRDYFVFDSLCPTFIYNDIDGNIIIMIAPLYPHILSSKKRKPSYGFFLKWMQTYKPIYKQIISKELALQWIDQANQILAIIDQNTHILDAQGIL
jgi:hypothetical protein